MPQLDGLARFVRVESASPNCVPAETNGTEALLRSALRDVTVAAVGPLVAETLASRDVRVDLMPADSFFLKPLVNEMADRLGVDFDNTPLQPVLFSQFQNWSQETRKQKK